MNIENIKKSNAARGFHFFSPDTLRFFSSRIGTTVYGVWHFEHKNYADQVGGQYFITSERNTMGDYPRLYTVRRFNPVTGNISTIGGFQAYKTSQGAAKRAMRERDREQATGEWEGKENA
jgi:hypothetical protein